jgi:hypothetical protein
MSAAIMQSGFAFPGGPMNFSDSRIKKAGPKAGAKLQTEKHQAL